MGAGAAAGNPRDHAFERQLIIQQCGQADGFLRHDFFQRFRLGDGAGHPA